MHSLFGTIVRSASRVTHRFHAEMLLLGVIVGLVILVLYARNPVFLMIPEMIDPSEVVDGAGKLKPEPHEGHLYHLGWPIVVLSALGVWMIGTLRGWKTWMVRVGIGVAGLIFIVLLVQTSGMHPREVSILFRHGVHPILLVLVFCVVFGFCSRLDRIRPNLIEWVCVPLLVLLVLLDPAWRSSFPNGHGLAHTFFFLAPIHDLLFEKTLLVSTETQYGLLLTQALAWLFQIVPYSFSHFYLVIEVIQVIAAVGFYLIARSLTRSRTIAFGLLVLYLCVTFLRHASVLFPLEGHVLPAVSRLRFMFELPILGVLLWHLRTRKRTLLFIGAVLVGIAVLYNVEVGLTLLLGYSAYVFFDAWTRSKTVMSVLLASIGWVSLALCAIVMMFVLFSLYTVVRSGTVPDFTQLFQYQSLYLSGFWALPMPPVGMAWGVLAILGSVMLAVCVSLITRTKWDDAPIYGAIAVYGIMLFHYYLARSHPLNLYTIAVPVLLLLPLATGFWKREGGWMGWVYLGLVVFIVALELTAGLTTMKHLLTKRYLDPKEEVVITNHINPAQFPFSIDRYQETARAIRARVPDGERPAILSRQDVFHLWVLETANLFPFSYADTRELRSWAIDAYEQMKAEGSSYLFLDPQDIVYPSDFPLCTTCDALLPLIEQDYTLVENIGLLDVYKRN